MNVIKRIDLRELLLSASRIRLFRHVIGCLFRQLEEHILEGAVQGCLFAKQVEVAAGDEPAVIDDADPIGQFLCDVE
jgi:hypothetical protein